ncbi:MAG: hypothetical protein ACTHWA_01460 [Arachnia sp.]
MSHPRMLGLVDVEVPTSGPAYWRAVWSTRYTAVTVIAALALLSMLVSARPVTNAAEYVLLAAAAVIGAITLATYVPPIGRPAREHLTGEVCAVVPVAVVLGAPVMLAQESGSFASVVLLLAVYVFAASKRVMTHASC